MITQDQVEKISDDFQSTFALVGDNVLGNLFFPKEKPEVERLIRKHVPNVTTVTFHQQYEVVDDYFAWAIEVK